MLDQINLSNVLFLDIETVPQTATFAQLNPTFQELWEHKSKYFRKEDQSPEECYERAGIFAEFGKVICISIGKITEDQEGGKTLKMKSFYGFDEAVLLNDFAQVLEKLKSDTLLCAHNGREFDFPYLSRRMLINAIKLPKVLDNSGKKPWEINHLDTLELWKFGDHKHYTSLNLLAAVFNIPTPKDDINGSQVASVYWKDKDVERIKTYCEKDVLTLVQLVLRFKGLPLITDEQIVRV
ncbi:3'-5' exonuclease [Solitalea koreensis]|uniref:Predicted 3'-5' exonuclease PolB-like domain-containing protein n=1 Tax=Solitalea koreensis TaxID=543615 RepID=A0A521BRC0_9SPHI|nr:3'-5' exonuclease [Solitalea koreensis]SMO49615.1 hypothetical protein SAMN06265350_102476 [Solitalea koreensis]